MSLPDRTIQAPFPKAEYESRVDRVKGRMEARGIDVLVSTEPANIAYLTGYDAWSWYTPQAVVVALDLDEPLWIGREQDMACALWATHLDERSILGYSDDHITDVDRHGMDCVAGQLVARGLGAARIGTEDDGICLTPRGARHLRAGVPGASFVDADLLVNWVRTVKSPAEIDVMRDAGRLALTGMRTAVEVIAPGVRECDAAAEIYRALIAGTGDIGGDAPWRPTMPSGAKTVTPHLSWTDAPYPSETAVNIELGGCRHQYHVGLSRTVHLGPAPEPLRRLAGATVAGFHAMLERVEPGATCDEVQGAFRAEVARHGYEKTSRCGYSIGLGFPTGAWVERTASLMEGDRTVLEPNMTLHLVLGMWAAESGFMFSETVAVTEGGFEALAPFERELVVKA